MPSTCRLLLAFVLLAPAFTPAPADDTPPRNVVLWISIDGFRADYLDRADTPTFDRLAAQGLWTSGLVPTFPSLTFPVHVSQATGTTVDQHGIPANRFFDRPRNRTYSYPPFSSLLRSEPLWETAVRQDIRTLVHDWPMGHDHQGPHRADYFHDRFDSQLSDRQRLQNLLDDWQTDADRSPDRPLQLLITWVGDVDSAGHDHGPDAPAVAQAVESTDELFNWFIGEVQDTFNDQYADDDRLYLFLTTDHGMAAIHTLVNFRLLTGIDERDDERIHLITNGNLAHLYFHDLPDDQRNPLLEQALAAFDDAPFANAYTSETLPGHWHYRHPDRIGDVIAVLDPGHAFSLRPDTPTADADDQGGPLGMHGYHPDTSPDMLGLAILWRFPDPLPAQRLDRLHSLQIHPTITRLLDVEPAPNATADPLPLP